MGCGHPLVTQCRLVKGGGRGGGGECLGAWACHPQDQGVHTILHTHWKQTPKLLT